MTASQHAGASLEIRLFGPFAALVNGHPLPRLRTRKGQWLLALLVLRHDREVAREWLVTTLWPNSPEEQAFSSLRRCLTDLRATLGAEAERLLSPTSLTLRLDLTGAFADVLAFDRAFVQGDLESLQEAVSLYVGPLLEDCSEEWVLPERERREQAYLSALERLIQQSQEQQNYGEAARLARLAVTCDPFRESAWRALMQALADHGDHAEVALAYRELREVLRREMNAEPAAETRELFQWLQKQARGRDVAQSPFALPSQPSGLHLPRPLTSFIGREKEIAEVGECLATNRLVTITGAGGVGKTRLALRVAETVIDHFPDGAWFVDFAPLSSPALVVQAVAKGLGLRENPSRPLLTTLTTHLRSKCLLLLLDNCEHLRSECARLCQTLLLECPGVKLLATSRQALGSEAEMVWRAPSLSLPATRHLPAGDEGLEFVLPDYEAPRLFVERAVAAMPAFVLTRKNAPATLRICRRLDGIPLAIELAAARLRTLTVEQILPLLNNRFRLLTYGSAVSVPRQQTLRAAIDWSYDLLSQAEQMLLRRLSVFAGGWTLEAAEAICAEEGVDTYTVVDMLTELVDRSLVVADEDRGAERRYRLLETIREYSRERLHESGEEEPTRNRHLNYFLQWAEEVEPRLTGSDQQHWLERMEVEHDNFQAALAWGLERESEGVLPLSGALGRFWLVRGHFSAGREWLQCALSQAGAQARTQARGKALNAAGVLARMQADHTAAYACHEESLALHREMGYQYGTASSLMNLGSVAKEQGDYERAETLYRETLEIMRQIGDRWGTASVLNNLGNVYYSLGDYVTARAYHQESMVVRREMGDKQGISQSLHNLGIIADNLGDLAAAITYFQESLHLLKEIGDRHGIALSLNSLGVLACNRGDYTVAVAYYEESLALRREIGDKHGIVLSLGNLGNIANYRGDYAAARAYHKDALSVAQELGERWAVARSHNSLGRVATASSDYAAARVHLEESLGICRGLGNQYGIADALHYLGLMAYHLGDFSAAQTYQQESLSINRELGNQDGIATSLGNLGNIARGQGDYVSARSLHQESLTILRKLGDKRCIAASLESFAGLAVALKQPERAARLWGAAAALREEVGAPLSISEREEYDRETAVARESLGEEAFTAAWAAGRAMTLEQAIACVLEDTHPWESSRK